MKTILIFIAAVLITTGQLTAQPDCAAPSTGYVPINDLGINISPLTGMQGGLYPNGSNFVPSSHKTAGLQLASQIQCLDSNGNPDATNGKIVWLSIGMSNCTQEAQQFIAQANAFTGKNPKLKLIDGAQGGQTASIISSPGNSNYSNFWKTVGMRLKAGGVNSKQVQVIWFKEANIAGTTPVKAYYDSLVVQIKRSMNEIKTRFPNVKICYLASRITARYAVSNLNPEPYSYWTGWAVKKVIEDQIKGDNQLSYSGTMAKSPWLAWGIYMWSDGSTAQITNPNIRLICPDDFQNDGTHPSASGAKKVGGWLLDFFATDSTSVTWFLGSGCKITGIKNTAYENRINIYPNPASRFLNISFPANSVGINIEIFNQSGKKVLSGKAGNDSVKNIDITQFPLGLYFILVKNNNVIIYSGKIMIANPIH